MISLEFTAAFGNDQRTVKLTEPFVAGGGFQVFVDNYYEGVIVKLKGEWVAHLNAASDLTGADILILGDLIDGDIGAINGDQNR